MSDSDVVRAAAATRVTNSALEAIVDISTERFRSTLPKKHIGKKNVWFGKKNKGDSYQNRKEFQLNKSEMLEPLSQQNKDSKTE